MWFYSEAVALRSPSIVNILALLISSCIINFHFSFELSTILNKNVFWNSLPSNDDGAIQCGGQFKRFKFNRVIVIFFKEFWVSNEEIGFKDILNHEYLTVKHGNQIEINIFHNKSRQIYMRLIRSVLVLLVSWITVGTARRETSYWL